VSLVASDVKLLNRILESGHKLEAAWPDSPSDPSKISTNLQELKTLIASCESDARSEDLKRLAFHVHNLTAEMTARHLAGILVPFERLRTRAVRDDEFLVSQTDKSERSIAPLVVIADNIRSAFNVGAIFRTAEAFGAEKVWLTGYSPAPDEAKTAKTSMGSQEHIEWQAAPNADEAIKNLKAQGYAIIALETAATAIDLRDFTWPEKSAILLGNERFGIESDLLREADHIVRIPLHGMKNSLNVGIAFGIAAADYRAKFGAPKPLEPIGVFKSSTVHAYEARRQGVDNSTSDVGCVELERGRGFEQALESLSGFERIWLLYRFHHNENWKPMVQPPRGPKTKRGVFATRSPHRPNPLGLSCVELVKVEGLKVHVRGFDLLDGSPIYDIKPYLPYADSFPNASAGWVSDLEADAFEVTYTPEAEKQLNWLEENGVTQIRGFIGAQLEYEPLDLDRKRLIEPVSADVPHTLCYRTWRANFRVHDKQVKVEKIWSGYSGTELDEKIEPADTYGDKDLHRRFLKK
jgi:tRNA (adenine37-N6)-methyltransferase